MNAARMGRQRGGGEAAKVLTLGAQTMQAFDSVSLLLLQLLMLRISDMEGQVCRLRKFSSSWSVKIRTTMMPCVCVFKGNIADFIINY